MDAVINPAGAAAPVAVKTVFTRRSILLPELSRLIEVQEIDREIQATQRELDQLPEDLRAVEEVLAQLIEERAAHLQKLEDCKTQRQEIDSDITEMEESIKKSRQRLMEIKSNIEYKAMLKEIAYKEDQRDQRETRILEIMERLEEEKRAVAAKDEEIKEKEGDISQQRQAVEAQVARLKAELARQEKQRQQLRKGVPAQLLKRYEFIRQRRNGTAIAQVVEGFCLGCHMNILPQQFIDLQKGEEILQCPHCQRVLYWLDEEAAAPDAPGRQNS
jgi:predicted  nucleic acid-binding Zn-ribbon protein